LKTGTITASNTNKKSFLLENSFLKRNFWSSP
jgi:hypothetical protein